MKARDEAPTHGLDEDLVLLVCGGWVFEGFEATLSLPGEFSTDDGASCEGEEEAMKTGLRIGESLLKLRDAAESEEEAFAGERKRDSVDGWSCFEGDVRMLLLLPEALRGDLDGETGGGILIESNMAARAAFSGDMGFAFASASKEAEVLRAGD